MVSVWSYRHRNEQYRGELLESFDRVAVRISEAVDRLGSYLFLENQDLSWGQCTLQWSLWCVDAETPPITRVSSMPPCGEREKQLELVGAKGEVWFISTYFSLFCFRVRRPSSLQESSRRWSQIACQSEFKASHHQPCDTWGVARMHGGYFLLNLPSLNRKI